MAENKYLDEHGLATLVDQVRIFRGTRQQWDLLSTAQKKLYSGAELTEDTVAITQIPAPITPTASINLISSVYRLGAVVTVNVVFERDEISDDTWHNILTGLPKPVNSIVVPGSSTGYINVLVINIDNGRIATGAQARLSSGGTLSVCGIQKDLDDQRRSIYFTYLTTD